MLKPLKNLKFEEALKRLEEMVQKLEEGNLPLDESLQVFEEGIELSRFCEQKLNQAEGRVEMILKDNKENP